MHQNTPLEALGCLATLHSPQLRCLGTPATTGGVLTNFQLVPHPATGPECRLSRSAALSVPFTGMQPGHEGERSSSKVGTRSTSGRSKSSQPVQSNSPSASGQQEHRGLPQLPPAWTTPSSCAFRKRKPPRYRRGTTIHSGTTQPRACRCHEPGSLPRTLPQTRVQRRRATSTSARSGTKCPSCQSGTAADARCQKLATKLRSRPTSSAQAQS
mmetsp:Transcript_68350/g.182094  ORF Transcript_68350/g.182094 Transcript_68350/m.182094 type:complete len:213 (+) Transcript_68350:117-755(+)